MVPPPPHHHPPNMRNVFKNSIADEWSCLGSEREEISQVSAERVMTSCQERFIMSEWRWNLSYAEKCCKICHLRFFYLIKSAAQRFFSRTTKKQRTQIALNCQQMADTVVQFHSFIWLNLLSRSLWSRFPCVHAQTRDLSLCCSSPGKTEEVWAGKNAHLHKFHSSELGQPDSQDNEFPSKRFLKCHWQQNREETTKCHVNLINLVLKPHINSKPRSPLQLLILGQIKLYFFCCCCWFVVFAPLHLRASGGVRGTTQKWHTEPTHLNKS